MAEDPLSPGLREGSRRAARAVWRLQLWWLRRRAARAETELGLLGWQQADFDPDTERQVQEIQEVEKEQTRLMNAAAAQGKQLRELRAERDALLRARLESRKALAAEERRLRDPRADLERKLAEKRRIEPNFQRRMPELDRELREVTKLIAELLSIVNLNLKMRQELIRLRERSVAIPNEKNDLRTQHLRTVTDIRALEEALARNQAELNALQERTAREEHEWNEREREIQRKTETAEQEKVATEKRILELETAKANPYQAIGRVLATSNIPPLNQPHALEAVKRLQAREGELWQCILDSEAQSAQENPASVRRSLLLWGGVLVLVVITLCLLLQ